MNFIDFVQSDFRNAWIKDEGMSIYIRRSFFLDRRGDFEIANITARRPGEGSLTRFLDHYEPSYRFYFEQVFNRRLASYLEKRGYVIARFDEGWQDGDATATDWIGPKRA